MTVKDFLSELKYWLPVKISNNGRTVVYSNVLLHQAVKDFGDYPINYWYICNNWRTTKKGKSKLNKKQPYLLVIEVRSEVS